MLAHVWGWFCDLSQARRCGFGPEPIGYADIEAYARLMRVRIDPFEVEAIRAVDRAVLAVEARIQDRKTKGRGAAPTGPGVRAMADARDAEGVKAVLRGFKARRVERDQSNRSTVPSS